MALNIKPLFPLEHPDPVNQVKPIVIENTNEENTNTDGKPKKQVQLTIVEDEDKDEKKKKKKKKKTTLLRRLNII